METIWEKYERVTHQGHPALRDTFLLGSIKPMVTIVLAYILFVTYVGPAIMKNRKPIQLRRLIAAYNFILVGYYVYFLLKGLYFMYFFGFSTFCGIALDSKDPFTLSLMYHGYIAYAVRYLEFLDTVFLVVAKKSNRITPMHVFHHAVVPVFAWFSLRCEPAVYLSFFLGFNSVVHAIMYTYYGIAALGPQYQKYVWWKKYLTLLQISQFFVVGVYLVIMYAIGCVTSKFPLLFSVFLCLLFFYLFIKYYLRTYLKEDQNGSLHGNQKLSFDKIK